MDVEEGYELENIDLDEEWILINDDFVIITEETTRESEKVKKKGSLKDVIGRLFSNETSLVPEPEEDFVILDDDLFVCHEGFLDVGYFRRVLNNLRINYFDLEMRWRGVVIDEDEVRASKQLKFLIRVGVPLNVIGDVWYNISGARNCLYDESYEERLVDVFGDVIPKVILKPPSFGSLYNFSDHYLLEEANEISKRILCVLAMYYPSVSFGNLIPDLVLLSLNFLSEEKTYHLISKLIEVELSSDENTYLLLKNKNYHIFLSNFAYIIQKRLPDLFRHFNRINMSMTELADLFFSRFLITHLPYYIVIQIFSIYINEGLTTLYKAGIVILKYFQRDIIRCDTPQNCFNLIQQLSLQMNSVSKFLKEMSDVQMPSRMHRYSRSINADGIEELTFTYYRPRIDDEITMFPAEYFEIIYEWIPQRYRIKDPIVVFHSKEMGYSINRFMQCAQNISPSLLVLKSAEQNVFGFFMNDTWKYTSEMKGDFSTFVFTLSPKLAKYSARESHTDSYVKINKDNAGFDVGISHTGFALSVDSDWNAMSDECEVFTSPPLNGSSSSGTKFVIVEICLFTFV